MPQRRSLQAIPTFETEDEEREFWATHDSADYVDWSRAKAVSFPQLKPSTRTISLRLPEALIENLKMLANRRDVPYQSLLKIFLAERVEQELRQGSLRIQKMDGTLEERTYPQKADSGLRQESASQRKSRRE